MLSPCLIGASDGGGGASRATYRLHRALRAANIPSYLVVQEKRTDDPYVLGPNGKFAKGFSKLRPSLDQAPFVFSHKPSTQFTVGWLPDNIKKQVVRLGSQIVNLHEVRKGNLCIETLANLQTPIVWTLHDMWALTGGCHYDQQCGRYSTECGRCPLLNSQRIRDRSHQVWRHKARAWKDIDITLVSPSRWLAGCAAHSSLFANHRIEVIPNGLDSQRFRPTDRRQARAWLGLPQDKPLLLFLAVNATSDERKGFRFLHEALSLFHAETPHEQIELVVVGANAPTNTSDTPFYTHYLGQLHDDISLALAYNAVDIFIAPSVQDNLPNTVVEAMACATPCIAFDIGGMPDMINHCTNGYLASPGDAGALADGIRWMFDSRERHREMGLRARRTVEAEFTVELQAQRYIELYQDLLDRSLSG